ncbi:lipopolysaccharide transport periplasmic protein LptA [Undibacterium sp. SXout7W]|uniref:lipopolysaccharide transport periplasmic protein LptA n=1 Tax=Undibacterium sp. SXout7W TaxID=3413049 RepID=UPI003BF0DDF2
MRLQNISLSVADKQAGQRYRQLLSILASSVLLFGSAHAERADSLKETNIEAEHSISDGKKNIVTLTGDVKLTRGTLIVKAERAVVTEAADGHQHATLYGKPGATITFRQKRDGGPDLWIEGEAERAEYDEKTELVKFITRARVKYLEGKKVTQEQEGEFLSYDSKNDVFIGTNSSSGQQIPGGGRIKLTLQPKPEKQVN